MTGSSAFRAYASIDATALDVPSGTLNVSCLLDGTALPTFSLSSVIQIGSVVNENNLLLCSQNISNSGEHEIFISTLITPETQGWTILSMKVWSTLSWTEKYYKHLFSMQQITACSHLDQAGVLRSSVLSQVFLTPMRRWSSMASY